RGPSRDSVCRWRSGVASRRVEHPGPSRCVPRVPRRRLAHRTVPGCRGRPAVVRPRPLRGGDRLLLRRSTVSPRSPCARGNRGRAGARARDGARALLGLLALPLAAKPVRGLRAAKDDPHALIPSNAAMIMATLATGILLLVGLALSAILRNPLTGV